MCSSEATNAKVTVPIRELRVLVNPQSNRPLTGSETCETKIRMFPLDEITKSPNVQNVG